jgi:hypothetical protein
MLIVATDVVTKGVHKHHDIALYEQTEPYL